MRSVVWRVGKFVSYQVFFGSVAEWVDDVRIFAVMGSW
jgi:hypothetical protein